MHGGAVELPVYRCRDARGDVEVGARAVVPPQPEQRLQQLGADPGDIAQLVAEIARPAEILHRRRRRVAGRGAHRQAPVQPHGQLELSAHRLVGDRRKQRLAPAGVRANLGERAGRLGPGHRLQVEDERFFRLAGVVEVERLERGIRRLRLRQHPGGGKMPGLAVVHELRLVGGVAHQHVAEAEQALVFRRLDELGVQQAVEMVAERRGLRLRRADVAQRDHDLLEHREAELTADRRGHLGDELRRTNRIQAGLQQLGERLGNGVAGNSRVRRRTRARAPR